MIQPLQSSVMKRSSRLMMSAARCPLSSSGRLERPGVATAGRQYRRRPAGRWQQGNNPSARCACWRRR